MSYCVDKYTVTVDIRPDPGVYVFIAESGTGKTYLASLLKEYMTFGEPVNAYDYKDYLNGLDLSALIQSGKYKVLMIDRYDMYYGEALEALRNPPSDMIILIDTKCMDLCMKPAGLCAVIFDARRVLVT